MQTIQDTPVDDQVLPRHPDRRPPRPFPRLLLAVLAALLGDQAPQVAARALVAGGFGCGQQPLRVDLAFRVVDLGRDQRPDNLLVPGPSGPLLSDPSQVHDPADGLVSDPAHLGGPTVGADLAVGGDDVQVLPR